MSALLISGPDVRRASPRHRENQRVRVRTIDWDALERRYVSRHRLEVALDRLIDDVAAQLRRERATVHLAIKRPGGDSNARPAI